MKKTIFQNLSSSHDAQELKNNHVSKFVRLDVRGGVTVKDAVDSLVREKRHQYEFNGEGLGCRYWVDQQMELLWRDGLWVYASPVLEARKAILVGFPDELQTYPLVVGSYYT
jgi:hypothetical protein